MKNDDVCCLITRVCTMLVSANKMLKLRPIIYIIMKLDMSYRVNFIRKSVTVQILK